MKENAEQFGCVEVSGASAEGRTSALGGSGSVARSLGSTLPETRDLAIDQGETGEYPLSGHETLTGDSRDIPWKYFCRQELMNSDVLCYHIGMYRPEEMDGV